MVCPSVIYKLFLSVLIYEKEEIPVLGRLLNKG